MGEIPPNQGEENSTIKTTSNPNKILPKDPHEVNDLVAMGRGHKSRNPQKNSQHTLNGSTSIKSNMNLHQKSPQIDTAQHYLDDNFSDVMRSLALGSNISSLFNTTAFNTIHNEQKVTLDWILPDGKNSQLETLRDKHIVDFLAPGGNTGVMLVYLPDLEPFYNTNKFSGGSAVRRTIREIEE